MVIGADHRCPKVGSRKRGRHKREGGRGCEGGKESYLLGLPGVVARQRSREEAVMACHRWRGTMKGESTKKERYCRLVEAKSVEVETVVAFS